MKDKIRIKFVDFWPGFDETSNYFVDLLGDSIMLSETPEIIFFSNFGSEHKKYSCFRVFFSSENERANMFKCDIALTFDFKKNKRHFRLPLYVLYAHQYGIDLRQFNPIISDEIINQWKNRKFCCFVVSNGKSKLRTEFFHFLSEKERIDSGGRFLNNIGGPVEDKLEFIKQYKFVIAFENSKYNGYTTEKILEPLITNSIPIYWGNKIIHEDFNGKCFIEVKGREEFELAFCRMKAIENDNNLIREFLGSERVVQSNRFLENKNVLDFIIQNFENSHKVIAKKIFYRIVANVIDYFSGLNYWAIHYTKGYFR
jgi:hypothetical protein